MQLHFRNFQTQKYAAEVNTKKWRRKREREENNNICFRESVASGKLWFANMWCTLSDTQTHILQPKLRTFIYFTTGGGAAAAEHTNDGELKSPLSFSPVRRIYYSFTAALWIQINQTKSTLVLFFFFHSLLSHRNWIGLPSNTMAANVVLSGDHEAHSCRLSVRVVTNCTTNTIS